MDFFSGIILGAVQGLTEFLPVSSTGHLILARDILGLQTEYGLSVDAVLQLATSLAVLVYFRADFIRLFYAALRFVQRKEVVQSDKALLFALVLGTVPAVFLGLLLENAMETAFRSAELVVFALLIGSVIMWLGEKMATQQRELGPLTGLVIGFFQSLALVPGMSRSGMTIAGGLMLGLTREEAARFGFMLAFPLIFGSGLKKLFELAGNGFLAQEALSILGGAIAAFLVGILVIHYLLRFLRTHTLSIFIWYRVVLAVVVLAVLSF